MTDREFIQGLIDRDNTVTEQFFFVKCRPLFHSIIHLIFPYEVDYDEFVNELYIYLMEDNGRKLRSFQYRSSVYQWLKILAIRFFINRLNGLIGNNSLSTLYKKGEQIGTNEQATAKDDLERLFCQISNGRYVYVIRKLILEDIKPETLAQEMGITTANLYNIKRRAMAALTRIALKDIENYGK